MKRGLILLSLTLLLSDAGSAAAIPPPPSRPVEAAQLGRLAPFIGRWSTERVISTPYGPSNSADFRDVRRVANTILIVGGNFDREIEVIAIDVVEESGVIRVFLPGRFEIPAGAVGPGTVSDGATGTCLQWETPYRFASDGYDRFRRRICVSGNEWRESLESVRADRASRFADQFTLHRN